ncbi:hypothetical protein HN865_03865 [Candidatus Woesearchaeota archaeon]|jgi:hypothetical protein|nr:hypothetical protein [Candidatus Woesearchaeota archaeon]MBT7237969.1 hypothetical protein [Candidatus Woesearchaeota archaeon]
MNKSILIVIVVIISIILITQKDASTSQKEQLCCENCLGFGNYEDTKDCLEIIKENGGIRTCYLVMENYPHTVSQCKSLIGK